MPQDKQQRIAYGVRTIKQRKYNHLLAIIFKNVLNFLLIRYSWTYYFWTWHFKIKVLDNAWRTAIFCERKCINNHTLMNFMLINKINWWHVLIIFRPCWKNRKVGTRPFYEYKIWVESRFAIEKIYCIVQPYRHSFTQ